jgi:Arc/MetJ-type ribon-helix-helix transcriptional regulator
MSYSNEPITITLSPEISRRVRAKIAENGYVDVEDVIQDGLDALEPNAPELERWLREDVVPVCEELDRDPTQVLTLEESGEALKAEYARFLKAG